MGASAYARTSREGGGVREWTRGSSDWQQVVHLRRLQHGLQAQQPSPATQPGLTLVDQIRAEGRSAHPSRVRLPHLLRKVLAATLRRHQHHLGGDIQHLPLLQPGHTQLVLLRRTLSLPALRTPRPRHHPLQRQTLPLRGHIQDHQQLGKISA